MISARIRNLLLVALNPPLCAAALPTVSSMQAFTENVGPNPYLASGWFLRLGATNIIPARAVEDTACGAAAKQSDLLLRLPSEPE